MSTATAITTLENLVLSNAAIQMGFAYLSEDIRIQVIIDKRTFALISKSEGLLSVSEQSVDNSDLVVNITPEALRQLHSSNQDGLQQFAAEFLKELISAEISVKLNLNPTELALKGYFKLMQSIGPIKEIIAKQIPVDKVSNLLNLLLKK